MPLFGRRLFDRNENDSIDEKEEKKSFVIEHTGEKFHSEKLYEKLKQVYDLERWTCECTWKSALTHKQALESEIESRKSLATIVPSYFHKTIFDVIHHNVKPLEKLAEEISIILGQAFVVGEPIQFKKRKDSTVIKGTIERIEENDEQRKRISERASAQIRPPSDKQMRNVKYAVRLTDEDRVINNVQPNELQRSSLIPNREKLKAFIRAYAIRLGNRADSPWIFYDQSVKENYQIQDRLSNDVIEKFRQSMTITLEEILREQEKLQRKQVEDETVSASKNTSDANGRDESEIILSDDEVQKKSPKKKAKSAPSTPKKSSQTNSSPTKAARSSTKTKSPTKTKKQLTLHDMKFTKNTQGHSVNPQLFKKNSPSKSVTTYNVAVPYSLLQKLDKTRRDRGVDSKLFQRLILHCARTLNDKQRLRLPDEYRSSVQTKFEELELKRRLSEMTEQEKKTYLQSKQKQKQLDKKPMEDLDLTSSKALPLPKPIETALNIPSESIGDLLVVCTFFTSCHSLFFSSIADDLSKTSQQFIRSFKHEYFIRSSSSAIFFNYFIELLQILMKLLFKEDENRTNHDETNNEDEEKQPTSNEQIESETILVDANVLRHDDLEQIYDVKLSEIPLTPFTCSELTRLYLSKEKDEFNRNLIDKMAHEETKEFSIAEQIELLLTLVNLITTDNELMSDYFEYLTRTMTETYRERNHLLAERRKIQEEESKQKKLQLQNGENEKNSSKKQSKNGPLLTPKSSLGTTNDENHQTSLPVNVDDQNEFDSGADDDLKSVIQRRRQMVAMSKELKEKRELEAQKILQEQKRELAIEKAEQAYQDALLNLQFGFRIKPLGFDRYYNRYWFFKGYAGLFVEKGWIGSEINYSTQGSPSTSSTGEKLIPKDEVNQWWTYDSETIIEQLAQALNTRGIREQNLFDNLKKISPLLHNEFEQSKSLSNQKTKNPIEIPSSDCSVTSNVVENSNEQIVQNPQLQIYDIVAAFKNDLEDIETRLRHGSLGGFIVADNFNEWQTKLKQSTERVELAELLIQLQQTVPEKFASGIFGTHEVKGKSSKNSTKKKSKVSTQNLPLWMNDCRTSPTYSRLYVLMMIFENSIAWNKSTVGLKCKICRKKNKDEYIAVCDQCCQGYHLECLRGYSMEQTKTSINDLWYCPACRPQPISKRRGGRTRDNNKNGKNDYYDADIYDMDMDTTSNMSSHDRSTNENVQEDLSDIPSQSDEESPSHEEHSCCVCGDDNDLIRCIQCRSYFHCQCHEPPLRCAPRSTTWMCTNCRNGVNNETTTSSRRLQARQQLSKFKREAKPRIQPTRQNGTRRTTRKNYRETDDDDEPDDNESDYEEEKRQQRRSKRLRRSSPVEAEKSDDEPTYSRSKRRRVRIAKSTSSDDDDDDDEQMEMSFHDEESDTVEDENSPEPDDDHESVEVNSNSSQ